MQIHLRRLQGPGPAAALVPQCPEDGHEHINDGEAQNGAQSFFAKHLPEEAQTGGRDVDEFFTASPEENRRDYHCHAGNAEGPARAETRVVQKNRAKNSGNEGAAVNRKIKPAKNLREQMFVRFAKLITNVGRNAWFNPARAERD